MAQRCQLAVATWLSWLLAAVATQADGHHRHRAPQSFLSSDGRKDDCPVCDAPEEAGALPGVLQEASGIAASVMHKGITYVINDNAQPAAIYAIGEAGSKLGSMNLTGLSKAVITNSTRPGLGGDWEAIAVGPCAIGSRRSCLFVADIGNNCARVKREDPQADCPWMRKGDVYSLIQVPEPASRPPWRHGANESLAVAGRRLHFRYPDGPHDGESLLISPQGRLYVISKGHFDSNLYELPHRWLEEEEDPLADASRVPNATKIASLEAVSGQLVTDADFLLGPGGGVRGLTVRTYGSVLHYPAPESREEDLSKTLADAVDRPPCELAIPPRIRWSRDSSMPFQRQGEGVTWQTSSTGQADLLLCGEGQAAELLRVSCQLPWGGAAQHSAAVHGEKALLALVMWLSTLALM